MKVLMVSDSLGGNGIGVMVYRLCHSLIKRGIRCDVVCYDRHINRSISNEFINNGDRIYIIPGVKKGIFKYVNNIYHIAKEGKYDVIHIHTSLMIFLAAYAGKRAGVPVRIGHGHGSKFFNYPEWVLRFLEPMGRYLNRRYCTDFVTCSQRSAFYTFGVKGHYVPNFVETDSIINVKESVIQYLRRNLGNENKVVFGYMGSLDGVKNVIFLVDIIEKISRRIPNVCLLLIGKGNMSDNIRQRARKLGVEEKVCLLGERHDTNVLVQTFDYYISSSKSEGMSLSMIEAQESGKPCFVSSHIPNDSDIKIGLFHKIEGFNAMAWGNEIIMKIENGVTPISRYEAIARAKSNKMTEEDIIDKLINIYTNDLNNSKLGKNKRV